MPLIRSNFVKFAILAFCAVLAALFAWLPEYDYIKGVEFKWNYWFAAAIYAAFLYYACKALKSVGWNGVEGWFRVHRIGLFSSLVLALFLQVGEPHIAKVLSDEDVICGVAYEMHNERISAFPTSMHCVDGRNAVTRYTVDKRPVGYPFVLSAFHDLTGYRYENVFILNGILGFVFVLLLYLFTKPIAGETGAVAVQILICTFPLLAQNVTAAGFEVFNLCMILAFALAARRYLVKPAGGGLDLFIAVALVLSIARYESALYLAALAGIAIFKWVRERRVSLTYFSIFSPLLLMSAFVSLRVFSGNTGFLQENEGKFLSIEHLGRNAMSAYRFLTSMPSGVDANSLLLTVIGSASILAFAGCFFMAKYRKIGGDSAIVVFTILIVASINTLIGLLENMGLWEAPIAARFSLPIHVSSSLCFAVLLPVVFKNKPVALVVPCVFAAWLLLVASFQISRHEMTNHSPRSLEYLYFSDWAEKNATARDLFVADLPTRLIMKGYPCVSINAVRDAPWKFQNIIDEKIYDNVYLCEFYERDPQSDQWRDYYLCCPEGYPALLRREIMAQTRIRPNIMVRVSRLVAVDDPEVEKHRKPADPALRAQWFSEMLP